MPSYTINTDTLVFTPYTGASTAQTLLENSLFNTLDGYRQTYGSTDLNEAIADFLAATVEGRSTGMVKQIRRHAAGLLAAGVAVPGAGGKFVAANQDNLDTLTTAAGITAAAIGALSLPATDGTRWQINTPARANTAIASINARISAVNGTRDSAIASFQALTPAQKRDFEFSRIVWPT